MKSKLLVATLQLLAVLLLCGCHTTYHAPDAKKLNASATRLKKAIQKSHDTAKKIKDKHVELEKAANTVFLDTQDLDRMIDELAKNAPPELQPAIKQVQDKQAEQRKHETNLQVKVEDERLLLEQLSKDNQEVTAAKVDWDSESFNYQTTAAAVATQATEDNKKLSSQLFKEKLLSGLGITGAIVFVVCLVAGFIMWKLGKLAIKF